MTEKDKALGKSFYSVPLVYKNSRKFKNVQECHFSRTNWWVRRLSFELLQTFHALSKEYTKADTSYTQDLNLISCQLHQQVYCQKFEYSVRRKIGNITIESNPW